MNRDQKAAVVDEIAGQIRAASAVFAVDYRGLSVAQAADLRGRLRESDTKFRIVKNSLSERAANKAGTASLKELLEGPTALALVHGDAALAAKALNDAGRAMNNILQFKGGVMDGAALSADEVRAIARLPAREILNAQLVGTIAAPLTGLVRGLNALIAGLAIALKEIADRGLVSGEAPAPEATTAVAEVEEAEAAADGEEGPASVETAVAPPEAEAEIAAAPPEAEAAPEAEPEAAEPDAAAAAEPKVAAAPTEAEAEPDAEPDPQPEPQPTAEPEQDSAADNEPSGA
jgi:large subunit ribosomal protein L10